MVWRQLCRASFYLLKSEESGSGAMTVQSWQGQVHGKMWFVCLTRDVSDIMLRNALQVFSCLIYT